MHAGWVYVLHIRKDNTVRGCLFGISWMTISLGFSSTETGSLWREIGWKPLQVLQTSLLLQILFMCPHFRQPKHSAFVFIKSLLSAKDSIRNCLRTSKSWGLAQREKGSFRLFFLPAVGVTVSYHMRISCEGDEPGGFSTIKTIWLPSFIKIVLGDFFLRSYCCYGIAGNLDPLWRKLQNVENGG